jgi:hypothetical protein
MNLTRKAFLQASAALVGGGILGCGGDDTGGGGAGGEATTTSTTTTSTTTTTTTTTGGQGGDGGSGGSSGPGGGGGAGGMSGSSCIDNGTLVNIGTNHGHTLTVPVADIQAGMNMTYNIQGSSLHPHTVTITAAQFAQLAMNQSIMVISSTDNQHSHAVTVSCA